MRSWRYKHPHPTNSRYRLDNSVVNPQKNPVFVNEQPNSGNPTPYSRRHHSTQVSIPSNVHNSTLPWGITRSACFQIQVDHNARAFTEKNNILSLWSMTRVVMRHTPHQVCASRRYIRKILLCVEDDTCCHTPYTKQHLRLAQVSQNRVQKMEHIVDDGGDQIEAIGRIYIYIYIHS